MARQLIASNATIKAVRAGDGRRRLNDGDGLYLLLFVKGGSHCWRFDYSFNGRRKTISFGTYPDTSLSLARKKADESRQLVRNDLDPSVVRQAARKVRAREQSGEVVDSFEAIAREWYEKNAPTWAVTHSKKVIGRFELDVFPWIGKKPITSIHPTDILEVLRRVEKRGAIETTHRLQQTCGQVFRYAVATARAQTDPSRDLRGALAPWRPQHYATLTDPREVGRLLRDIDTHVGKFATKCAMQLAPMLFGRSSTFSSRRPRLNVSAVARRRGEPSAADPIAVLNQSEAKSATGRPQCSDCGRWPQARLLTLPSTKQSLESATSAL